MLLSFEIVFFNIKNKYICNYEFYYPNADKIIEYIDEIKFDKSVIQKTKLIYKAFFILESIKNLDIKKCIVYLKTIEELEQFKKIVKLVNVYQELKLSIYCIDYKTSKNARNIAITKFRNNTTKISILLNVHVLDEGIDIPECDSIFITYASKSKIRNIQRLCRANRKDKKNPGKISSVFLWCDEYNELASFMRHIKEYDSRFTFEKVKRINSGENNSSGVMKSDSVVEDKKDLDNIIIGIKSVASWYENLEKVKTYIDEIGRASCRERV